MPTNRSDATYQGRRATAESVAVRFDWSASVLLAAIGGFALAVGLLVYATDRDPAHAMLFPQIAVLHVSPIFGVVGLWLPSFVHPFGFSLFTAAALPRAASPAYGACAAWWAVNMAFEVGQHPQVSDGLAESLQLVFGQTWPARALSNYFLHGGFHVGDLLAATAGALAAAGVLYVVHHRQARHTH